MPSVKRDKQSVAVKAVIDTNIWVSALINPFGYPASLINHFKKGTFTAVVSIPILEEIAEVLGRPRIRNKYDITEDDIRELLILIEEKAEHVILSNDVVICRDKDDNLIIETAIKGKAGFLISRDDDIKFDEKTSSFLKKRGVTVISISKFLSLVEKTSS